MSKVFEPTWGNPSLRSIIEPELPEPISYLPATPGWWILLIVLLGLILRALWRRRQRYLADQYRREALLELSSIKNRLDAGALEAVRDIAPLLRATAIAVLGREQISGLQGEGYAAALAELTPDQHRLSVADIDFLAYAPLADIDSINLEALIASVEHWIEHHRRRDA